MGTGIKRRWPSPMSLSLSPLFLGTKRLCCMKRSQVGISTVPNNKDQLNPKSRPNLFKLLKIPKFCSLNIKLHCCHCLRQVKEEHIKVSSRKGRGTKQQGSSFKVYLSISLILWGWSYPIMELFPLDEKNPGRSFYTTYKQGST